MINQKSRLCSSTNPLVLLSTCKHCCILEFNFRSGVLQANGIAPRVTSTNASSGHEDCIIERDVGIPNDRTSGDIKPVKLNGRIQSLEVSAAVVLFPNCLLIYLIDIFPQ